MGRVNGKHAKLLESEFVRRVMRPRRPQQWTNTFPVSSMVCTEGVSDGMVIGKVEKQ